MTAPAKPYITVTGCCGNYHAKAKVMIGTAEVWLETWAPTNTEAREEIARMISRAQERHQNGSVH